MIQLNVENVVLSERNVQLCLNKNSIKFLLLEVIITVIYHIKIRNRLAFIVETSHYILSIRANSYFGNDLNKKDLCVWKEGVRKITGF